MNSKFKGFSWAGVRTRKFDETKKFFERFFGIKPHIEEEGFAAFNLESGQTFEVFSEAYKTHKHFTTGPVVGFDVDDIDVTRGEMEKMGIEFIGETDGDPTRSRWAHFIGPDDKVYELKQRSKPMKAVKYSPSDTNEINLGTKRIYKYPTPTKEMDIARMVVKGRHPQDSKTFILEHTCQFVIYVTKGSGKIYAGDELFRVSVGDVVFVPTENKFAVEGDIEYVTVDLPAFFPEQSEETK
ncbi:MAG: hypothetical protein AABX29_05805 [Nanoarchaeota archaeon]